MKMVTICGSIRKNSANAAILEAYSKIASDEFDVIHLDSLRTLPHFDPDVTDKSLTEEVLEMRELIHSADVIVFSTPEYIHAMPAILKNCLEWLVGDVNFQQKPVVLAHAHANSNFALQSLKEVLTTMSAVIIQEASIMLSIADNKITSSQILSKPEWRTLFEGSVDAVTQFIKSDL